MLFIPSAKQSEGTGHIRRCLELLAQFPNGYIYCESDAERARVHSVAAAAGHGVSDGQIVTRLNEPWNLILVDRRATTEKEFLRYAPYGVTVGLDEGGAARGLFSYLIDTLPLLPGHGRSNIASVGFQPRPSNRRSSPPTRIRRALLTFGGEDAANLTGLLANTLVDEGIFEATDLSVVVGPLFGPQSLPEGVIRIDAPPLLREELHRYDVVFTTFGLTAYESVHAGVPVILVNPTGYHRSLARLAGFPEIGVRSVDLARLRRLLEAPDRLNALCSSIDRSEPRSLADHIASLSIPTPFGCPVCGGNGNRAVARFPDRSFFRCETCTTVYELDFSRKRSEYDRTYFFEEYRRQYGRTYLEDFDNIRAHAAKRVSRIARVISGLEGKRVLDVGCAFGPFLVEARAAGAEVYGVDVSQDAVEYVRSELGLPCEQATLESFDLAAGFALEKVDIVTMWYVVEHFAGLGGVLEKVNRMLAVGGLFAFSTPNLDGISGRTDLDKFLENSPYDHFSVWSPRIASKVLGRFGFRVRSVRVTGHHPERFPVNGASGGGMSRVLGGVSRVLRLGDTFECYAVKESGLST